MPDDRMSILNARISTVYQQLRHTKDQDGLIKFDHTKQLSICNDSGSAGSGLGASRNIVTLGSEGCHREPVE